MQQQPPPQSGKQGKRQIRLELPRNLDAKYSNAVIVSQTANEIIMDFTQIMPNDPRARVQSRIVMTPTHAKSFLNALQRNLEIYEGKHGEIKLPQRPPSLADQLFSNVNDQEDDDEDEDGND